MRLRRMHRQSEAIMTLTAVVAFISGAGLEAPAVLPAIVLLAAAALWEPSNALRKRLDPFWKVAAVLLAARAAFFVLSSPQDVVLPMVDLLLLLLVAEIFRQRDTGNDARVYALTFALLIASAAYRPGALFALAFVAYMASATVSLMLGHLLHSIERRPISDIPIRRAFLLQSAAFSGVALLTSALVFLAFPRVTRGWVSRGLPTAGGVMGFSDRVSLSEHGGQIYPNPQLVMRVDFPRGVPDNLANLHWRGFSFDRFNGVQWLRTTGVYGMPGSDTVGIPRKLVAQHIYGAELPEVSVLFGLHSVMAINSDDGRMGVFRFRSGDYAYEQTGPPAYTVYSNVSRPTDIQLQADSGALDPRIQPYLQTPQLSPRMQQLVDSLALGRVTTADKVAAVESYLEPFRYTVTLPATARQAGLEYFLLERRQGHCEYFSTAMAVLLRAMGVPTRNVNGFLGGEWNPYGKFLNVTQNQAHSWVEVWYPRYGWIEYDPTPASLGSLADDGRSMFGPLRAMLQGVDYRWNRWVLEYDMKTQLNMFSRVTDAFRATPDGTTPAATNAYLRWILSAVALFFVVGIMRRQYRGPRAAKAAAESAAYLKMRKAYEKRGYPGALVLAPLAFAESLNERNAPGRSEVARAVALYVRARFGGEVLSEEERAELRDSAARAREAIRSAGPA